MENEQLNTNVSDSVDISTIKRLFDERIEKLSKASKETTLSERVSELEFKTGRLWSLLTEQTPTGKVKLSQQGRIFAGKIPESKN